MKGELGQVKVWLISGGVFGNQEGYLECQINIYEVVLVSYTCFGDQAKVRGNGKVNALVVKSKWTKEMIKMLDLRGFDQVRYVWNWWKVYEVGKSFGVVNLILIWWLVVSDCFENVMSIIGFFKVKECFVDDMN